jgi:hypothetical protein
VGNGGLLFCVKCGPAQRVGPFWLQKGLGLSTLKLLQQSTALVEFSLNALAVFNRIGSVFTASDSCIVYDSLQITSLSCRPSTVPLPETVDIQMADSLLK